MWPCLVFHESQKCDDVHVHIKGSFGGAGHSPPLGDSYNQPLNPCLNCMIVQDLALHDCHMAIVTANVLLQLIPN